MISSKLMISLPGATIAKLANDGLFNNKIVCIYEDKLGHIWFCVNGGLCRYDGHSFRNYLVNRDTIMEDRTGKSIPNQRPSMKLFQLLKTKQVSFGLAQGAIPSFMMEIEKPEDGFEK